MTVQVKPLATPVPSSQQVLAARLDVEISQQLGEVPDPWMVHMANNPGAAAQDDVDHLRAVLVEAARTMPIAQVVSVLHQVNLLPGEAVGHEPDADR